MNRVHIAGKDACLKLNAKKTQVMDVNNVNTAEDIEVGNTSLWRVLSILAQLKKSMDHVPKISEPESVWQSRCYYIWITFGKILGFRQCWK